MYHVTVKNFGEEENFLYYPGDSKFIAFSTKFALKVGECGEFTINIPANNANYSLVQDWSIVTVYRDDKEYWRGFIKELSTDFYNNKEIYCIEDLGWLNFDSLGYAKGQKSRQQLLQDIIDYYNSLEGIRGTEKEFLCGAVYYGGADVINYSFGHEDSILSALRKIAGENLYIRVRRENGERYIDLLRLDDFPTENTQDIQFGYNLLDFAKEVNTSYMLNVIYPYGAEVEDSSYSEDGEPKRIKGNTITNATSIAKYGRIAKNIIFDGITDIAQLDREAENYLLRNAQPRLKLEINALDMSELGVDTSKLDLGDSIHVIAEPYGIDQYIRITKLEPDIIDISKNQYTLSDSVKTGTTLTQQTTEATEAVKTLPTESEILKSAKKNIVNMLMGATGGYYNDIFDSDGHRIGWQITDSLDPDNASWKWLFNSSGLGYLYKEYNDVLQAWEWKSKTAMTADGQIVADVITTGILRGIEINNGNGTFRVDSNGNLSATNASIKGTVSGSNITGCTISGGSLKIGSDSQYLNIDSSGNIKSYKSGDGTGITCDSDNYSALWGARQSNAFFNGKSQFLVCDTADIIDAGKSASDRRLKKNIKRLPTQLSKKLIDGTKTHSFEYTYRPDRVCYGVIAQEVQELLDEIGIDKTKSGLVHGSECDDYLSVEYKNYIPHLINYVKDLQNQINVLKGKGDKSKG